MNFYISDLHIGSGKQNDFHKDNKLISFVQFVRSQNGLLRYVGDAFELLQCRLIDIVKEHSELIDVLMASDSEFVPGNHDADLIHLRSLLRQKIYPYIIDNRTLILHGNIFDKYNNPKSKVGEGLAKLAGALETVGIEIDVLGKFWRSNEKYHEKLAELAIENNCNKVIFGHTHKEECIVYQGIQIANCGTWTGEKMPYIVEQDNKLRLGFWE